MSEAKIFFRLKLKLKRDFSKTHGSLDPFGDDLTPIEVETDTLYVYSAFFDDRMVRNTALLWYS